MKSISSIFFSTFFFCIFITKISAKQASSKTFDEIYADALAKENYIIQARRTLHQHPETRFEEYETSQIIKSFLQENNITYSEGWGVDKFNPSRGGTGVVADIGNGQQPCVILRADFDALPIYENNTLPFKSINDGKMHACGHDSHTTMVLGAAHLLKKYENELEGTVRLMFTPAEEGGGGVKMMIDEGVLDVYPYPQRAFGFHIYPFSPTGHLHSTPAVLTGGVDHISIKVKGKGGHGAMPHQAIDPLPPALAIVRGLYDIHARETYFQQDYAGLLTVTHFEAGTGADNIIPSEVLIGGTVQAIRTSHLLHLKSRIKQLAENIAEAYQCTAIVSHRDTPYYSIENNSDIFPLYEKLASEGTSDNTVHHAEAVFGGDDFCFFGEMIPSIYSWIGTGSGISTNGDPPSNVTLHNANFILDEAILSRGAALHTYIAIQNIADIAMSSN